MASPHRSLGIWGCVCLLAHAGTALADGEFHFEDSFDDREVWENAQTNTALPAWSVPGQGAFTIPTGGTPFTVEVVVNGSQFQIRANSQTYFDFTDADLQPGSVGVHSWGQSATSSQLGTRCERLTVLDPQESPLLDEHWTIPWTQVRPPRSDGAAVTNQDGALRWDFVNGGFLEPTNASFSALPTAPGMDFGGPTFVYTGPDSQTWTDYTMRLRLHTTDDDGMGVIVRYQEDDAKMSFYRVTFVNGAQDAAQARPPVGVSIQKLIYDKTTLTAAWSELFRDTTTFVYTQAIPFDLTVSVQNISEGEVQIKLDIINDPSGGATVIPTLTATDTNSPLTAGTVGLHIYGNPPMTFNSHGGVITPLLKTMDDATVLIPDVFAPGYQNWTSAYTPGDATVGAVPNWHVRFGLTSDLIEASNGREADGVGADGLYRPYIMYKAGFNSGTSYTLRAILKNDDNDGLGLVFGYQNEDNYFRVGFRIEASGLGYPQGISVQKVVNGTITHLGTSVGRTLRSNMAGLWVRKLATGTLEMTANSHMYDGVNLNGVEYQGPRLVAGDVNWTDYTYQATIEAADNDGIGILFRYQNENTYYRIMFQNEDIPLEGAPPRGFVLQRVANGVYTDLLRETDITQAGDNDLDPTAGFIYDPLETLDGYKIWRPRVVLAGDTIRLEIDAILSTGQEFLNYYTATIVDPAPITHGKIGLHSWGHQGNEFRQIQVILAGQETPIFQDADGTPDPRGWEDVTIPTLIGNMSEVVLSAGAPISGFGIRPDLDALGVRDNSYVAGTQIIEGTTVEARNRGCMNFDGPRAVVGKLNWKDYTYKVDARMFDDDGLGIVFRYQDENNFYRLMLMSQSNNASGPPPRGVSVQKRLNGEFSELFWDNAAFIFPIGGRMRIELTATGAHFDVKITELDGPNAGAEHVYAVDDPDSPLLTGKIGVTAWGANGVANEGNTLLNPGGLDWTQNFFEAAVFDNVVVDGTRGPVPPDFNDDGLVDGADLILWSSCVTGPEILLVDPTSLCEDADVDADGDVDQTDYSYLQRCYTGPAGPIDPLCVE